MIKVISFEEKREWEKCLTFFKDYDIYYLREYLDAFRIHGDGQPSLWFFYNSEVQGICSLMIRDISNSCFFKNKIKKNYYFDAITPYGYGGFIFNRVPSSESQKQCYKEFIETSKKLNIISVFFRFHPIFSNAKFAKNNIETFNLGNTIQIDLSSPEIIWENITSKNRNMIRKAKKNGIIIKKGFTLELLEKFKEIYDLTMKKDNATEYYFFSNRFYHSIYKNLNKNAQIFYAEFNGQIIAMSIMLFEKKHMIYHLSGSIPEYRNLAPSNLLLYEAAKWGSAEGYEELHLGGGLGAAKDNLYKFKASFNRQTSNCFHIGKIIIDNDIYTELLKIRLENGDFDLSSKFFPLYRS